MIPKMAAQMVQRTVCTVQSSSASREPNAGTLPTPPRIDLCERTITLPPPSASASRRQVASHPLKLEWPPDRSHCAARSENPWPGRRTLDPLTAA